MTDKNELASLALDALKRLAYSPTHLTRFDRMRGALDVVRPLIEQMERTRIADGRWGAGGWRPTHRHVKTGGLYRLIAGGRMEADLAPVAIYDDAQGRTWVRPSQSFYDGRFESVSAAESDGAGRVVTIGRTGRIVTIDGTPEVDDLMSLLRGLPQEKLPKPVWEAFWRIEALRRRAPDTTEDEVAP